MTFFSFFSIARSYSRFALVGAHIKVQWDVHTYIVVSKADLLGLRHVPRHDLTTAVQRVPLPTDVPVWTAVARESDVVIVVVAERPLILAREHVRLGAVELEVRSEVVVVAKPVAAEQIVPVEARRRNIAADAFVEDRLMRRSGAHRAHTLQDATASDETLSTRAMRASVLRTSGGPCNVASVHGVLAITSGL